MSKISQESQIVPTAGGRSARGYSRNSEAGGIVLKRRAISDKADRLCASHRVILLGAGKALVIGDHDTYDVVKLSFRWTCNCLWGRFKSHWCDCSHIVAVRRALKDSSSQVPVARLADLLHNALNSIDSRETA